MATTTGEIIRGAITYGGSLAAAASDDWVFIPPGRFTFDLSNTFVANVIVERRNADLQVSPCTAGGNLVIFAAKASELVEELEGAEYRVTVTAFTSGTVSWRFAWRRA